MIRINNNEIYYPIKRAIELLKSDDFKSLFILGSCGTGKSFQVDKSIKELKLRNVEFFSGELSEVKFYEFLKENENNKILVMRDMGKWLRRISVIDVIKILTENKPVRHIERKVKNNTISINFTSKIIFEVNDLSKRYKDDITALFSRGLFVDLNISNREMKDIMFSLSNSEDKIKVTKYLVHYMNLLGKNFNLRTQDRCFKLFEASKRDKRDWKNELTLYLNPQSPWICKELYRIAGNLPIKRIALVRTLMSTRQLSYSSANRYITNAIDLGYIYNTNGLQKQMQIALQPINNGSNVRRLIT